MAEPTEECIAVSFRAYHLVSREYLYFGILNDIAGDSTVPDVLDQALTGSAPEARCA